MRRVLIAEDDRDLRGWLRDELADNGFTVTAVANGAEAVVAAATDPYDLFLLDMLMPALNGIQAIRVLRKIAPAVPILGLTGNLGKGYMAEAAGFGVTCLAKPIAMTDLLKEIEEALHQPAKA